MHKRSVEPETFALSPDFALNAHFESDEMLKTTDLSRCIRSSRLEVIRGVASFLLLTKLRGLKSVGESSEFERAAAKAVLIQTAYGTAEAVLYKDS